MTLKLKKFFSKLNNFHIILLGFLLGSLLIFNSNHINQQKAKIKLSKEQDNFFKSLISKRQLSETDDKVGEVCSRGSEELNDYYKTGDPSKIDLDNGPIKCEDKNEDYMQALINLVRSMADGGDDKDENQLRELLEDEDTENIKTYATRIFPMVVFLGIGVLSIIGYIVCWISCCCNCCCCCCFKKPCCKIPCFIFTYVFYALVVVVCIYGLTQTSKIFTGLANTECSLLQFFNQILNGENKADTPKWIGIQEIDKLLKSLDKNIREMEREDLVTQLDYYLDGINEKRDDFLNELKTLPNNFYEDDGITPLPEYCIQYSTTTEPFNYYTDQGDKKYLKGNYVLELIPLLGKYKENPPEYEGGIKVWYDEISVIDNQAGGTLGQARTSFNSMLGAKLTDIKKALNEGQKQLGKLKEPFDNFYGDITDILYDASDIMDSKGKLSVNLVFGLLAAMNICLAALMLFICMCSGQACVDSCCLFRNLFKFATHILWNILAILMILSFLVGSILGLTGRIGGDMMSLISFIVSEDNFNNDVNPLILGKLGEGKNILEECIVKDGNLSSTFGLTDVTGEFDSINDAKKQIEIYIQNFTDIAMNYWAYHGLYDALKNMTEFINEASIRYYDSSPASDIIDKVDLGKVLNKLNDSIGSTNPERWNINGDTNFECIKDATDTGTLNENKLLHPWTCEPEYRDWVSSANDEIKNYAKIATDIINVLKYANGTNNPEMSYYDYLNYTKSFYEEYLKAYLETLGFFKDVTGNLIDILERAIGTSGDTFSFLNGKFIKINLKIILKYLKYSLGEDIYTVGICLVIVGLSLILSVSSTILLIVIINVELEEKKKMNPGTNITDLAAGNDGRIVKYDY